MSIPNALVTVAYMIDMTVYSQGHPTNYLHARSKKSQEPPAVQCMRCSDSKGYGDEDGSIKLSVREERTAELQHSKGDL